MSFFPDLEEITRLRKRLGITQQELAKLSHVSQSTIAKIEAGRLNPSYDIARRIFNALFSLQYMEPTAKDLMNTHIVALKPTDTIGTAIDIMNQHGYSQLPILDDHKNVGSITDRTVMEFLTSPNYSTEKLYQPVSTIMEDPFPLISLRTPLSAFVHLLKYVPAILVSDGATIKGILTKSDVFGIAKYQKRNIPFE